MEKKKKKRGEEKNRIEIGAARFQSRRICTVDSISWRKRANNDNWPESRGIKRHRTPEATLPPPRPLFPRKAKILVLHREVISSLTRARKEATGVDGRGMGRENWGRIISSASISGRSFARQVRGKPAKFVLIVPRIGFGGLRQEALWKMLRPYRHWLVKGTLYRRLGTLSPSRR